MVLGEDQSDLVTALGFVSWVGGMPPRVFQRPATSHSHGSCWALGEKEEGASACGVAQGRMLPGVSPRWPSFLFSPSDPGEDHDTETLLWEPI